MAPVRVDPAKVHEFRDGQHFTTGSPRTRQRERGMDQDPQGGFGVAIDHAAEAVDAALCFGWIDAVRKAFDGSSYLQRYTPRGRRSMWSRINVENVARLAREGRMTGHGLKEVEAAKADGRWDRAYGSGSDMQIPDDLQAAIDAEPKAREMLERLSAQNRFALAFRTANMKTAEGRRKKIETFVDMLKRGETIYRQKKR